MISIHVVDPLSKSGKEMLLQASPGNDLRSILLRSQANLYQDDWTQHSRSCGGGGSCFTCLIQLQDGQGVISERSEAEHHRLKGKPSTWRLSCQCIVVDQGAKDGGSCTVKLGLNPTSHTSVSTGSIE
jgi:ferredoxin